MADPRKTRIPRRIRLMGYDIHVHQATQKELQDRLGEARPLEGLWDDETCSIFIYKGMSFKKKRIAMWHEISHALIDLRDHE